MLRRSPFRHRSAEWRRELRSLRRGVLLALGPKWNALAQAIRERDGHRCRRCGWEAKGPDGSVDHVVPRRLCAGSTQANRRRNLCLLDTFCHSIKTHTIEKALFAGDPHPFYEFLTVIGQSGPTPSAAMVGAALTRVRRLLEASA